MTRELTANTYTNSVYTFFDCSTAKDGDVVYADEESASDLTRAAGGNVTLYVAVDADYAQAVSWAVRQGITQGVTATQFQPQTTCNRGQIVTFLYRAYH